MKVSSLSIVFMIFLGSQLAVASVPSGHPVLGIWEITVPGTSCLEYYEFKTDGTRSVKSAAQTLQSRFEISPQANAQGFYKVTDTIIQGNDERDCSGEVTPVGDVANFFVRFQDQPSGLFVCFAEAIEKCVGPFERVSNFPSTDHYSSVAPKDIKRVENEMCEKAACQYGMKIALKKKDGSTFEKTYDVMPVVQENGVSVYAGKTVLFEADVSGDNLINLTLVTSVTHPEKTISAALEQAKDGSMNLELKNPFKRHLRVHMGIMSLDRDNLLKTSSCPVIASGGSYEMWPYPVFQVWLGSPHLLKDGDDMSCIE